MTTAKATRMTAARTRGAAGGAGEPVAGTAEGVRVRTAGVAGGAGEPVAGTAEGVRVRTAGPAEGVPGTAGCAVRIGGGR
ncbi:hypothetical protein SAMN05421541_10780 [Actinoplanes philippinensis]|uniref:Uncharacterized protein n=1 Tax=Actinoplanes philippinensis TaxID=35752 RepID=A0A1I2GR60_9ACTN|nr:hypothetical protein SAMN05421541_10780 [Actinoplanes philippinensis]